MKKPLLLFSAMLLTSLSYSQENCCDVVDSSGVPVISSNGACVVTAAANTNCDTASNSTPKLMPEEVQVLKNALEGVKFKTNSDELLPQSYPKLDAVAELMKSHDDFKLKINGYTDNTGASEYNHKLSHKRAEAAKARLVEDGIAASRITTYGYGEENPVASNDTAEGRAQNRRVEFKVSF